MKEIFKKLSVTSKCFITLILLILSAYLTLLPLNSKSSYDEIYISEAEAERIIKEIPEIKKLVSETDSAGDYYVDANTSDDSNTWFVWVYYLKKEATHTFTIGHYEVNKITGVVTKVGP